MQDPASFHAEHEQAVIDHAEILSGHVDASRPAVLQSFRPAAKVDDPLVPRVRDEETAVPHPDRTWILELLRSVALPSEPASKHSLPMAVGS